MLFERPLQPQVREYAKQMHYFLPPVPSLFPSLVDHIIACLHTGPAGVSVSLATRGPLASASRVRMIARGTALVSRSENSRPQTRRTFMLCGTPSTSWVASAMRDIQDQTAAQGQAHDPPTLTYNASPPNAHQRYPECAQSASIRCTMRTSSQASISPP